MRINNVTINDQTIPLSNMVVIVGSNGTGKTRLLEELNWAFTNRGDKTNFWKIKFEENLLSDDISKWFVSLIYYMERNNKTWYSPFTKWNNDHDGLTMADEAYSNYTYDQDKFIKDHGVAFIKEFIHYLPVNQRLTVGQSAGITPPNQRTNEVLNLLFKNRKILDEINIELIRTFKKKALIMPHILPNIELRVVDSDIKNIPKFDISDTTTSYQNYVDWLKENEIVNVSMEGHGIQAFLHIMLTYCVPLNHLLLIDEPEIHLYPSVKRKFGNTLGKISENNKKQFICVTHDSDFLQGIFDSKCDATIIRIKKIGKSRELFFKAVKNDMKYLAGQNQTPFLQIPFLDAAIIVEGATDRLVYESVFYDNNFLSDIEYKFISAGGKDSISNPVRIANDLKVPYVVILDIENLKIKENLHLMKLNSIKENDDLLKEISEIGKNLGGIENFTSRGVEAILDKDLKERVSTLIAYLKTVGIFIVYKGTLESWGNIEVNSKNQFPEKFIEDYNKDKKSFKQMISFLKEIETYLLQYQ